MKKWKMSLIIALAFLLLAFAACSDDDDDDDNGNFEGANYTINANIITGAPMQDPENDEVEIIRNNPSSTDADECTCILNGETLECTRGDADTAYYDAASVAVPEDSPSTFTFIGGDDSTTFSAGMESNAMYDFTYPTPMDIPNRITPGDPITLTWDVLSGTAENTRIFARCYIGDSLATYCADIDFTETSHTIPGSFTTGAGQPVNLIMFMVSATENHHAIEEDNIDGSFYCGGYFDAAMLYFEEDTTTDTLNYTMTIAGDVFTWEPGDGAMTLTVYRDSGEGGGAIWTIITDGTGYFTPPVTYGVVPAHAFCTFGPTETLQHGERYTVTVAIPHEDETGDFVSGAFTY